MDRDVSDDDVTVHEYPVNLVIEAADGIHRSLLKSLADYENAVGEPADPGFPMAVLLLYTSEVLGLNDMPDMRGTKLYCKQLLDSVQQIRNLISENLQ